MSGGECTAARGEQVGGAGSGGEARSSPRLQGGAAGAAATAAAVGRQRRGAASSRSRSAARRPEPPLAPSPRGEVLQGGLRRPRGGAQGAEGGGRVRPPHRPPRPGPGVWALGPSAESSGAGALREAASVEGQPSGAGARLRGKLQARPGRGNAGRSAGKGEPGRERTRGEGARFAGSA